MCFLSTNFQQPRQAKWVLQPHSFLHVSVSWPRNGEFRKPYLNLTKHTGLFIVLKLHAHSRVLFAFCFDCYFSKRSRWLALWYKACLHHVYKLMSCILSTAIIDFGGLFMVNRCTHDLTSVHIQHPSNVANFAVFPRGVVRIYHRKYLLWII